MAGTNYGEDVAKRLRGLWSSFMSYTSQEKQQDKREYLELFMAEFLDAYHGVKGELKKISNFGDIHSVSNVLTSEFQAAIFLKCQDETEQSLVYYLCQGHGLLLLQMLCILAHKIAGCSLDLANLLLSLLPVVVRVPLQNYDPLYGLEVVLSDFDEYCRDSKSTSSHANLAKKMIVDLRLMGQYRSCMPVETGRTTLTPQEQEHLIDDENLKSPEVLTEREHNDVLFSMKGTTESPSSTEDSDILTSLTSVTDLDSTSTNASECADMGSVNDFTMKYNKATALLTPPCDGIDENDFKSKKLRPVLSSEAPASEGNPFINSFQLSVLLVSTLENLTCQSSSSLHDPNLLMETCGQLIEILHLLGNTKENGDDVLCNWEPGALIAVQLVILRTVFAILYTTCKNPKAAKQLSKSVYVGKLVELISEGCLDKEFLSLQQHHELAKLVASAASERDKGSYSKLSSLFLWKTFQQELLLCCSLQGLLLFLTACLHHGTVINPTLIVLCQEIFEQFSSRGGFESVAILLIKLDEIYPEELSLEDKEGEKAEKIASPARKIEQQPKNLSRKMVKSLGKMVLVLKKGKSCCKAFRELRSRKNSLAGLGRPVIQEDNYVMCETYLQSSEVEESSESAADMESESQRQDQFSDNLCAVSRPAVTLLTVFKESRNAELRMNLLSCLEKVGICHCVSPDILVTSLLSRFLDQPKDLQCTILRVLNQLVLTEVDIVDQSYNVLTSHFSQYKRSQRSRSKPTKQSPSRSDSGFFASDFSAAGLGAHLRDMAKEGKPRWTCLSQYCALVSAKEVSVALEVTKALKPLATLGSKQLKEELFRIVVLPCILRCDGVFTEDVAEPLQKIKARTLTGSSISDWQERRRSLRGSASSTLSDTDSSVSLSKDVNGEGGICQDVLELFICFLSPLLSSSSSRELFLNCGGLNEMQCFLALPQLQEPVLHVLEYLVKIENRDQKARVLHQHVDDLSAGSPETSSEEKTDNKLCCRSFLSLLHYTSSFGQEIGKLSDDSSELPRNSPCHPVESSLRVHVWKSCLQLLMSNELFCEMFLQDAALVHGYDLLCYLFQFFQDYFPSERTTAEDQDDLQFVKDLVSLFETVLPICIRMAHTEHWQNKETLPSVEQLVEEAKKTVAQSKTLQNLIDKGLSNCFLKASIWQQDATTDTAQMDSVMKQQRNEILRRASTEDSQEDWSHPLEDDDDDNTTCDTDGAQKGDVFTLEEGYDADQEGDSDWSDDAEQRPSKTKKQLKDKRGNDELRKHQITKGLIIYPQICNFLLELLEVCFRSKLQAADPDCLPVVIHAVESLLLLVKDCEENCRRLCHQGFIGTLLYCFHHVLITQASLFKDLQSITVDVFVCLARYSIRANELWDFLSLFNSPDPPVQLLSAALSEVAAKASVRPGPAFVFSFPCFGKVVQRRSKVIKSSKVGSGKRIKGKKPKIKSSSPHDSYSDTPSEEDSLQVGSSPSRLVLSESLEKSPKRSSQRKPKSLNEGGKRRGSTKRVTRIQSGSLSLASTSGDYELTEVVQYEGCSQLPSPFLVRAVQLAFRGGLPRSERGLSLSMWLCLSCPGQDSDVDSGLSLGNSVSSGPLGCVFGRMNMTRQERIVHLCSIGSGKSLFELWIVPSKRCIIARWTKNHKGSSSPLIVLKERFLRLPALKVGDWHHLVFSLTQPKVTAGDQKDLERDSLPSSKLLVVVDGTESTIHDFGPPLPWHEEAKFTLSMLLIGDVISGNDSKCSNFNASLQCGYEIGNVFVFTEKPAKSWRYSNSSSSVSTDWLIGVEEAFFLYSLGPSNASLGHLSRDFNLVSQSLNDSTQPFLEAASLWSRLSITEQAVTAKLSPGFLTSPHIIIPDLELYLQKKLAAVYCPSFPLIFHQHAELLTNEDRQGRPPSTIEHRHKPREREPVEITAKITSEVVPQRRQTLLESAHDVGGISVFIYLFAKVVEMTKDEKTQADALSVVLSLQYFSDFHARAMAEESGFALLKRILLSPECKIGYHTLKVLMEAACSGDVFKPTNLANDPIMLNIDSTAVVRNVAIFQHFLLNWKIWEKAKQGVLEMLLATIDILVHGSHCYYEFNIIQFQKAQLVQQILIGCQERQSEGCKEIPRVISSMYVNIIQNIMGRPPDLTVLKAVCEFLIAVHPTDDINRLHAPSRCYLREHSLDFVQVCNHSSPTARGSLPSPRTTPIRSIHSPNPFKFSSPGKRLPRCSLSRSLSYESVRNNSQGNRLDDVKSFKKRERLTQISASSVGELNRSPTYPTYSASLPVERRTSPKMIRRPPEDRMLQFGTSLEEGQNGTDHFTQEEPGSTRGDRKLTVFIPQRKVSEGLSSSALVLHEDHFLERTPSSPVFSPGTPLATSYPGTRSIPGSKPVVIGRYGSTPSRDEQSSLDLMEYDMINESDFSSLRSSVANPSSNDDYLVVEGFPGLQSSTVTYCPTVEDQYAQGADAMIKLRLGLMKLLEKKLFNLPSEHVPAVIGEVLKAEYMLIWAYHHSDDVRELAIRILFQYLQKAEPKRYDQFLRIHGFHLLANQLYDHAVTKVLIEGCLSLLVDRPVDLNKDYDYSGADSLNRHFFVRPLGIVPLLALLENSLLKPSLFHLLIQHLCQLFIKVDDLCLQAVDHGLLETLCNVVYGLCTLHDRQRFEKSSAMAANSDAVLEDLQQFVVCIVRKACSTNGNLYFQMFEDLLIAFENLEEQDHKKRDHDLSTAYCARYFRLFAIQVALHFFQEVSKGEVAVSSKKTRSSGLRLPFRGPDTSTDPIPSFTPVSSWINLNREQFKLCLDPSQLKKSPTSANSNEQTRRFQVTCQLAVSSIVYCKTFFMPEDFDAFHSSSLNLEVHDALRPGIVRVLGAAIEREFAQFVFSLLLEILDACLDGRKREIYKLFIVSKDSLKAQIGKLLVFLLNPNYDLDLACFALHLVYHPRAKKILEAVLTSSGGPKLRERVAVYLLKILAHPRLTPEQKKTGEKFKAILLSMNLQSMRLNAADTKSSDENEIQMWESADNASMMQWQKQRYEAYRRLEKRTEDLSDAISNVAKDVTRVVVEIQDAKRQALLKHTRDALSAEVQIRKRWRQLIERLIHERSVWHDTEHFPSSWRLDPTEGPDRVRCRLQRFHLDVDKKYVMEEYREKKSKGGSTPLSYLFEDTTSSSKKNVYYIFDTPDTIRFLHHCKNITLDSKIKGVLLIGESHMYFVGEEAIADTDITQILLGNKDAISISWSYEEIQEIRTRWYCLQDNGLEIFLTTGRTYLLAFDTRQDREIVLEQFKQRCLPCYEAPQYEHLITLSNRWRSGQMTNFQYLTELNKMAGRSFNDLMQYPVFPFVLSDFDSEVLDLNDFRKFRDLSRPIAVQNQSKERKYREKFKWLQEEHERMPEKDPMSAPYHYGCHYSNSGTVLHFLVRLPPFTKMFVQYQDRSFDIPDRTFHSLATTWRLSSFESATDVKELIPEFFFLSEFLENAEGFDFGLRQNGSRVMNVEVPHWAKGSTRLFMLIHRQALESDYVSQHLNQWIDLVFGYKQRGREAIDAINVFHPATYYGVDVNAITDQVRQKALKTMIETYGQTPQQLFTFPHSPRPQHKPMTTQTSDVVPTSALNTLKFMDTGAELAYAGLRMGRLTTSFSSDTGTIIGSTADTLTEIQSPVSTVEGLKWGQYVGSPALGAPAVGFTQALNSSVQSLVCLNNDNVFALGRNTTLLTVRQGRSGESEERLLWAAALSWGYMDGCIRVSTSPDSAPVCLMEHHTPDKITCCAVTDGCNSLFVGTSTGTLSVLPIKYNPRVVEAGIEVLGSRVRLHGHKDSITCIELCQAFSIVVSGSCDRTAIIWDLNRLSYVRFLRHKNTVAAVSISRTTGDIATVSHTINCETEEDTIDEGSVMKLWNVNGRFIDDVTCEHMINCLEFSSAPEGMSVNVIATGLSNGAIRLWSTWDLRHIRDIAPDLNLLQVVSLKFSDDSQRLFAVNTNGKLVVWQTRDKIYTKPPVITVFQRS